MNESRQNKALIDSFKAVDQKWVAAQLTAALNGLNRKIVVLDDDPTGVQTVHDVSVYTDWEPESIAKGFAEEKAIFFILTNSRGLSAEET